MELIQRAKELNLIDDKILTPNVRQIEWYNREKMIFFHFGMNTFTGKEWGDGTESPSTFNPSELCVEQWIKIIKEAGFKCAILTAKHHDGFCLWQTKYTEHSIKNSPYKDGKGDIVAEFTSACNKHGIKAGIYLSPWDRHEKTWGKDEYNDFYVGQLTELLSNYGKIWEVWWDGAGSTEAVYDWERWAKTVKSLAPDATIFGSLGATPFVDVRWVGNEKGIAGKPCYATIDKHSLVVETTSELNSGKVNGNSFIPAEVDVSIRPGWFYHAEQDNEVRTPQNLMRLWFTSNGSNAGLLLNLPPDKRGLVHENDERSLLEFSRNLSLAFENNLLKNAKITFNNINPLCNASSVLSDDKDFVAPCNGKEIELEIELENEVEFNAVIIREGIEIGHRVVDFELFADINGEKRLLIYGNCIGYRRAEHINKVKTKRLYFRTKGSLSTPVITFIGVYMLKDEYLNEESRKARGSVLDGVSVIERGKDFFDINFGGVKEFNYVRVNGALNGEYTLYVFNGTSFDKLKSAKATDGVLEINLEKSIDYAYRIKICAPICENATVQVLNK